MHCAGRGNVLVKRCRNRRGAQGGGVQRELILKFRDSPRRRRARWYGEEWGGKRRKRMDSVGCLTDPEADSRDQCSAGLNVPS